jgi:hypothetical protein
VSGRVLICSNIQNINPLNAELNPIYYLLALFGVHHILHISRIRVKMYNVKQKITSICIHNEEVNNLELELSIGFNIPTLRFKAYGHVAGGGP